VFGSVWKRLLLLVRRDRFDRELDEEMRFHVEMKTRENLAAGASPEEAHYAARRAFGNLTLLREVGRDMWGFTSLESLLRDFRYSARTLRKSPGFTLVAIVSLALGIGVNTAIFNLFNEVFLKDLSARDPGRLLRIEAGRSGQMSYPNYRDLQENRIFDGLAAYTLSQESWSAGTAPRTVRSHLVTSNFFDVLGVQAARGRTFPDAEAKPEQKAQLVVLSHQFWQRQLGSEPDIIGRDLTLNGRPFTIIGILPEKYRSVAEFGEAPELYLPLSELLVPGLHDRDQSLFIVIGRLPAGLSRRQAEAGLTAAARRLEQAHPQQNKDFGQAAARAIAGIQKLEKYDAEVWLLAGLLFLVVSLVFVIACANVASMLLARGVSRRREIAMRLALGASRRRLVQQLLVETMVLALLASCVALLFNLWLNMVLNRIQIPDSGMTFQLEPDFRLLLYALSLAMVTSLLCGLVPALQATRSRLVPALKDEAQEFGHRRFTLRNFLVAGQVAVSVVLLVTAGLFVRSLLEIGGARPGFDVDHTLVLSVNLIRGQHTGEQEKLFFGQAMDRLEAVPGARSASCAGIVPLSFASSGDRLWLEGQEDGPGVATYLNVVGRRYFETLGIPVLRGREFGAGDREGVAPVAIVNEAFIRRYSDKSVPDADPLGKRLIQGEGRDRRFLEIVGVVADSKYLSPGEAPEPQVYLSYLQPQQVRRVRSLLLRTAGPPAAALAPAKRAIADLDRSADVEVQTMSDHVSRAFWPSRIGALVLGSLGGLGMLLAMVGLYGVMSYAVSRRTSEIGIRMALGASRGLVLWMVLKDGLILLGVGGLIGLAIAALATGPLAMFLASTVSPTDPATLISVLLLIALVGAAASFVPARRATGIDPVVALRRE
jgi:putative ABC transport system permease protein